MQVEEDDLKEDHKLDIGGKLSEDEETEEEFDTIPEEPSCPSPEIPQVDCKLDAKDKEETQLMGKGQDDLLHVQYHHPMKKCLKSRGVPAKQGESGSTSSEPQWSNAKPTQACYWKLAWKDTTLDEMMAFIGVIFDMGNVKKNQIRDYWSKNELLKTPWFVIVAVYACGVDVEKGPIRQQLWNAPP
ncbi:hypothetical protein LAZ67_18001964 [Cordylochernes scorpioides]|uniref:PiggyBac transposable element-derived protein domain-containing protein n=1 Tax=Cordylochernes scorpioides TaxID=51811 RepID=A0ABY6LL09_9ARAC|nr:hypothetical protein LAZ67_18001964 [Cordylochernes scorpioides]